MHSDPRPLPAVPHRCPYRRRPRGAHAAPRAAALPPRPSPTVAEPPELRSWQQSKQPQLVERLRERLAEAGIPESHAAVLAWTNALVERLNRRKGSDRPVGSWLLRALGAAAVERDERVGPNGETFRRLDRAVAFVAFGSGRPANSTYEQRERIRTASAQPRSSRFSPVFPASSMATVGRASVTRMSMAAHAPTRCDRTQPFEPAGVLSRG